MGQPVPQKQWLDEALLTLLPQSRLGGARALDEAVHYAVFPGGKRLRPILTLLGVRVFDGSMERALPAACAVEFIHTSSLIFDDLPCMDDASIRRGLPTVHRLFGEDVALLAGLSLMNRAYSLFGESPHLLAEAARCIGTDGMIGGQALDVSLHGCEHGIASDHSGQLRERNRKTSAMMRLALIAGPLACGRTPAEVDPLGEAGQLLGEAYQIGDDLQDMQSSQNTGKVCGQDHRHGRLTHATADTHLSLGEIDKLIERARRVLEGAYGTSKTVELMTTVDVMFEALLSAATNAC